MSLRQNISVTEGGEGEPADNQDGFSAIKTEGLEKAGLTRLIQ